MLTGILGAPLVETAIGMIVVWFLAASLCSAVVELAGSVFGFRANHLWNSLGRLLQTAGSAPEAAGVEAAKLASKPARAAQDSPLATFVSALPGVDSDSLKRVREIDARVAAQALVVAKSAKGFVDSQLGKLVAGLPAAVRADDDRLREWLERWFDGEMASVRAVYRRKIRWWAAFFAVFVVVGAGLDSLGLAERLYTQPAQRAFLQAEATRLLDDVPCAQEESSGPAPTTTSTATFKQRLECAQEAAGELSGLKVSFWQARPSGVGEWVRTGVGMTLSWVAVLAGAPFWFALLKRMMSLQRDGTSETQTA